MKKKLTTLLFGLLLAVGWTSSAFAQESPNNIPDAVYPKSYYDALTYTWQDANNATHTSKATDLASDPYQIYELLRFVYGNPYFPGPKYGAYKSNFEREDPIEYPAIQGGWNITAGSTAVDRSITINVTNNRSGSWWSGGYTYYYVYIKSIKVYSGDELFSYYDFSSSESQGADEWTVSNAAALSNNNELYFASATSGTITIPTSALTGASNVKVVIEARRTNTNYTVSLAVNGSSQNVTSTSTNPYTQYTWNVNLPSEEYTYVQGTVVTPFHEGYTALLVAVKDDATPANEGGDGATGSNSTGCYYNTKQKYVNYIANHFEFVQLLTDGLRIGSVEEHTSGTVFNCSATLNKFFIISKGQAREKSDYTKNYINNNYNNRWYYGEVFPFQTMYEEFSPTTGDSGAEIKDFYTEMQDGHVYNVVHDCASVPQEEHQFSMSGNKGTERYAMSSMNFFIPDYRLLYWNNTQYLIPGTTSPTYSTDGRDMNAYELGDATGKTGSTFINSNNRSYFACYFANYNQDYAPKVGIYKITLDAEAKKVAGYDADNNHNYEVTLNWVSSLNEMSGEEVPQTYKVYRVWYDENGDEHKELLTTTTETTYSYVVPQNETSYSITYLVEGSPTGDYPSFVANSNLDDVVIPGLNDFLALKLDHYESDFVIGTKIGDEKNYYRNFLHVASDDEGDNALTVERINGGENEFKLYRYDAAKPLAQATLLPVGTLEFWDRHDNKNVGYGFTFETGDNAQDVEPYTLKTNDNQTISNAYSHDKLGMPQNNNGFDLRIKGNGDITIQPNGYAVNFLEISVYNGTERVAHWQVSNGALENVGWILSPGSRWIKDPGTDYYYLEGGGYIAIPDMMNNYENLTVVIKGFGDSGELATIAVNDRSKKLDNAETSTGAKEYTWNVTSKTYKYVKVTNPNDLTSGEYLIVQEDDKVAFNSAQGNLDAASNFVNVTINHNEIANSVLIENAAFTIDMSAGSILSTSGYYIGNNSGKNRIDQSVTSDFVNTITVDEVSATITCNSRNLQYNPQSGQNRFRYYGSTQSPVQLYKKVETTATVTDHVVRLGSLPIIDQFSASTAKNNHPFKYGYVLKYEPKQGATGEAAKAKSSSIVEVPVQHTGSVVNGYYTQAQVDNDKDRKLMTDVLSADMQMELTSTNSAVYYYSILSSKDVMPKIDKDSTYYVSNLQNDNFTYQEMFKKSPNLGERYPAGTHYIDEDVPVQGSYGQSYKTYVPFITERAIERYYYVEDSLHNTYGAPIWATGVGKVDLGQDANIIEREDKSQWSQWTADGEACCLYRLHVDANCYLPDPQKSNVDYEPYMMRIWVTNADGFRDYEISTTSGYPVDKGAITDTIMWLKDIPIQYQENVPYYHIAFGATGDTGNGPSAYPADEQLVFGALKTAKPRIIVRFYFKAKGATTAGMRGAGDDYNASEGSIKKDPATAVYELHNDGEVVSKTYYNAQGMKSDKPFDGMNIVITRYSDGTTTTTKEMKL